MARNPELPLLQDLVVEDDPGDVALVESAFAWLNEHVTGQGFPSVRGWYELLREALEIINLLWPGGYHS